MVKVSIIITVYNREKYLKQALDSILNQTFKDFELIVWDDGSSDRSSAIAQEYAKKDKRIKAIAHPHTGRIPSLIAAKKVAKGEYLALVDSDDYISSNCLETTVKVLDEDDNVGMVYTDCQHIDKDGVIGNYRKQNSIPFSYERLLTDFICFHFRIYRRELYEQIGGYDLGVLFVEDYDLSLKLAEITQVKHVPQATYFYRIHPGSQGAKYRVERIYWTKKAIENSIERTNFPKKIRVSIPKCFFKLIN